MATSVTQLLNFPSEYVRYVFRLVPPHDELRGIDVLPHFEAKILMWSLFFTVLHLAIPRFTAYLYPKWYASLDERKRREYPAYLACLFHHFAMVPRAWLHVVQDFFRTEAQLAVVQYAPLEATISAFCIGYFIGDTICFAIPQMWLKNYEYIVHHVLTLWIVVSSLWAPGHFCRYIPHLLLADTTNIFFNVAWLLRLAGWKSHWFVTALELLFAFAFLMVRALHLPIVFFAIQLVPDADQLGWARLPMVPIGLLQWYWGTIIVRTTFQRLRGGSKKRDAKKVARD